MHLPLGLLLLPCLICLVMAAVVGLVARSKYFGFCLALVAAIVHVLSNVV